MELIVLIILIISLVIGIFKVYKPYIDVVLESPKKYKVLLWYDHIDKHGAINRKFKIIYNSK